MIFLQIVRGILPVDVVTWMCIIHRKFNFSFELGPKVGLHIIQECIECMIFCSTLSVAG